VLVDVNKDGILDLVTANDDDFFLGPGSVSVLLGNGNGTFGVATLFATGTSAEALSAGDLNNDGNVDLVTANRDNSVSVLLGNGDGTFATATDYITGAFPESVSLQDLNGDGFLDIATADSRSDTVSVLMNNGDGTFSSDVKYATGDAPRSLAVGDLDGDGDLDLMTSNECSADVSVLLNNGNATFAPAQSFPATGYPPTPLPPGNDGAVPRSVALADANGDGHLDVAVGFLLNSRVSLLLGNGDGTFADEVTYDVDLLPTFVALGDLNEDARPDLVVLDYNPGRPQLSVLLNVGGNRIFGVDETTQDGYVPDPLNNDPQSLATADLDGDGDLDMATANFDSDTVSVLLNNGDGTFAERVPYEVGDRPWDVAVANLDGDMFPDLVVTNSFDSNVAVLINNGDGSFGAAVNYSVGAEPLSMAVDDVDGDGAMDLVVAADSGPDSFHVSVLLGNGNGTFAPHVTYDPGVPPWSVAVGHLNADAHPDIVAVHRNSGHSLSVLLNNGDGTFAAATPYALGSWVHSVDMADLDNDGDLDVAVGLHQPNNTTAPDVAVLLNTGDGILVAAGTYFVPGVWQSDSLAIGDLDGDGVLDLAIGSSSIGNVAVLLGNGDGTFAEAVVYARGSGQPSVVLGDFDADGDLDLAVTNSNNDNVSILFNRACDGEPQPCPADLDGNGEVGPFDLALLLGNWGPCDGDCPADLDDSGAVGAFDLALLLGAWGPCP
ncbi:MAG: VCBS repeat-containing protein, partial [Acidobacteria bacterium]|nr:VCBS repeat-containing protein [Acidobacteriota bacterium]